MKYRPLGKTGLNVSEIGVGAWQLGGPLALDGVSDGHPELGREYCINLIRRCGELGINFIDTAEQYGNGESERRVGEALKGVRDRWILSTKFGYQVGPQGERLVNASPARVRVSLEGSLKRLQTDYIDVYIYHAGPKPEEAAEVAEILLKAKQKGQVRAVGISTNNLDHLELLRSHNGLDVVQFAHSLLDAPKDAPIPAYLQKHGIGGVVRGAFAGGRLSGRYFHTAPQFHRDDVRSIRVNPQTAAAEFARFRVFEEFVTPKRGMIQLALRYLLDEPSTSTIIPGGKSVEDYAAAIRATELPPLTKMEQARIAELREALAKQEAARKAFEQML